jgi:hypothetical protein
MSRRKPLQGDSQAVLRLNWGARPQTLRCDSDSVH